MSFATSGSRRVAIVLTAIVSAALLVSQYAAAQSPLLDTAGFDGYIAGPLQGQSAGSSNWVTIGSGGGSAIVEPANGVDGTSGVHVTRGASSNDWWAVSYSGDNLPTSRFVFVDWDMRIANTNSEAAYGPFIGVVIYDDTLGPHVLGALGVDASTRDVLFEAPGSADFTDTGVIADEGWSHYQIRLDYLTHSYSIAADGASLTLQPLAFVSGASDHFTDADIAALAAGADYDSVIQMGTADFDNFVVRQTSPGDYNGDGLVDAADYTVWRDHVADAAAYLPADGDGDVDVDQDDYDVWSTNYGASVAAAVASTTPEPSALALAVPLVPIALRRRRT